MVNVIFALFALMVLGGGLAVVTQRNIVRAAAALMLSLFGVAGLYVLLEAGFLAAIQILVYMGAIAILIIFTVMLSRRVTDPTVENLNSQWVAGLVAALGGFAILVFAVINEVWPLGQEITAVELAGDATANLGVALLNPGRYVLPFEVASVLLLGAMIGAIVIVRRKRDESV